MQIVYEASHVIDAHLVLHALQDAGIPAFIRGEALVGGLGELGVFGLVAVCVPDARWQQARAVVDALGLGEAPSQDGAQDPSPAWDTRLPG